MKPPNSDAAFQKAPAQPPAQHPTRTFTPGICTSAALRFQPQRAPAFIPASPTRQREREGERTGISLRRDSVLPRQRGRLCCVTYLGLLSSSTLQQELTALTEAAALGGRGRPQQLGTSLKDLSPWPLGSAA